MTAWTMGSEDTAAGEPIPVIADGDILATVRPIWSADEGVRVSVDWTRDVFDGMSALGDMSIAAANALSVVLRQASSVTPPSA